MRWAQTPPTTAQEFQLEGRELAKTISKSSTPAVGDHVISADLDGEAVMLNLQSGVYYGLDGVGFKVWGLIQEGKTFEEITHAVVEEYEVEPDECRRDVRALLRQMADKGLVAIR